MKYLSLLILALLIFSVVGYFIVGTKYSDAYNLHFRGRNDLHEFRPLSIHLGIHSNKTFDMCISGDGCMVFMLENLNDFLIGEKTIEGNIIISAITKYHKKLYYIISPQIPKIEKMSENDDWPDIDDSFFHSILSNAILKELAMYVKIKKLFVVFVYSCLFLLIVFCRILKPRT